MLRIVISLLASSLLAAGLGHAQERKAPPATASGTGVLLALLKEKRDPQVPGFPFVDPYETWWIVRDQAGAHVIVKLPDIIVPRRTGFWRLGNQRTCQFRPPDKRVPQDQGEIIIKERPYGVPVEETPYVSLDHPPCDPRTRDRVLDPDYDHHAAPHPENAPVECSWASTSFLSVLPDLISISFEEGMYETCDPHVREEYDVGVQKPESLSKDGFYFVSLSAVLGDSANSAWNRAIQTAWKENYSSLFKYCSDTPPPSNEGGWYLYHNAGRWYAGAAVQSGEYRMDCVVSGVVNISVPRSLTHTAPLPVSWTTLKKQLPGLADAFLAPDDSVLVAVFSKKDPSTRQSVVASIQLFDFTGNKLGEKLLDLPPSGIVMAEWATGRFVQSWTDSLTKLASSGLPAPVFIVSDSSP